MKQRTMVKISAEENIISLRTVSRAYRSTQRFMILRRELEELKEKKKVIVSDIHSFAVLRLYQTPGGLDVIDFDFSWLSDDGYGRLSGKAETVRLSYETFMARTEESSRLGGQPRNLLSIQEDSRPRIEFESRRNLQEVAKNKRIRRQLGKFLDQHFNWRDSQSIFVTDDYEPYSFFFTEKKVRGNGICGGIILHGQDNMKNATYSIHT